MGRQRTRIPDFDRLVTRSGHDRLSVWREGNRIDIFAVGVGLLRLEIQRSCQASQKASDLAKVGRFGVGFAPESQTLIVRSSDPDTILLPSGEK